MLEAHARTNVPGALTSGSFLEVKGPANQSVWIPVRVQNLLAGTMTLEVLHHWSRLEGESLKDREGRLILRRADSSDLSLMGRVSGFRLAGARQGGGVLDFSVSHCDAQTAKQVQDFIGKGSRDRKSLWDRWDANRANHESEFRSKAYKLYLLGLALTLVGVGGYVLKNFNWDLLSQIRHLGGG